MDWGTFFTWVIQIVIFIILFFIATAVAAAVWDGWRDRKK